MKADIFFFVTTIAVIIVLFLIIVAFFYFIKILRNFKDISQILKDGTEKVSNHLDELSETVLNNPLFKFFFNKKRKTRKKE